MTDSVPNATGGPTERLPHSQEYTFHTELICESKIT